MLYAVFVGHTSEILFLLCAGEGAEKISLCENLKTSIPCIDTGHELLMFYKL